MDNKLRNEVEIVLAGETRTMRATFDALVAIEKDLGKSVVKLHDKIRVDGDAGIMEIAGIIYHGLRGYGDTRLTMQDVGKAVIEKGFIEASTDALKFLVVGLVGAEMGKPEAPEVTKES